MITKEALKFLNDLIANNNTEIVVDVFYSYEDIS